MSKTISGVEYEFIGDEAKVRKLSKEIYELSLRKKIDVNELCTKVGELYVEVEKDVGRENGSRLF